MAFIPWTAAELEALNDLVGNLPRGMALGRFQRLAKKEQWPARSDRAVLIKAQKMGLSWSARGDWITSGEVARLVGIQPATVQRWFERHPLECRRIGSRYYYQRVALRRWARQHPQLLGGIEASVLYVLLEDRALADEIAGRYRHRPHVVPVRCRVTGRVFASQTAAARALHVTESAVSSGRRLGYAVLGAYEFEEVQ